MCSAVDTMMITDRLSEAQKTRNSERFDVFSSRSSRSSHGRWSMVQLAPLARDESRSRASLAVDVVAAPAAASVAPVASVLVAPLVTAVVAPLVTPLVAAEVPELQLSPPRGLISWRGALRAPRAARGTLEEPPRASSRRHGKSLPYGVLPRSAWAGSCPLDGNPIPRASWARPLLIRRESDWPRR